MRCKKANILLSAYIDGELDKREKAAVEIHIGGCSRCRGILSELQNYKKLAGQVEKKKAPDNLDSLVWQYFNNKGGSDSENKITFRPARVPAGLKTAAAIAAILISVSILYFMFAGQERINANYYPEIEKGGKGPPRGAVHEDNKKGKGPAEGEGIKAIISIAEANNAIIKKVQYPDGDAGRGRIRIILPSGNFSQFREDYNKKQINNPIPVITMPKRGKKVLLTISFPVKKYFAGDFNSDNYDDLLVLVSGLNRKSSWFIALNDSGGNFRAPLKLSVKTGDQNLSGKEKIITGDFNGDGYDDLMIIVSLKDGIEYSFIHNIRGGKMEQGGHGRLDFRFNAGSGKLSFHAGDLNGDSLEDLLIHHKSTGDEGQWIYALNNDSHSLYPCKIIECMDPSLPLNEKYLPFTADINGDGMDDIGIYGQSGDIDAKWIVYINKGTTAFEKRQILKFGNSNMAFQGDYHPLFGDFNADGLTDILVKYGAPETFSNWYRMINLGNFSFSLGEAAEINDKTDFGL